MKRRKPPRDEWARKLKPLIREIQKARAIATEMKYVLGNGALVADVLGNVADEMEMLSRMMEETRQRLKRKPYGPVTAQEKRAIRARITKRKTERENSNA